MEPRDAWDKVIDTVTLCLAVLLLLHAVAPGTTEVPMPNDDAGKGETEVIFPYA